jgi:hypothetical protein
MAQLVLAYMYVAVEVPNFLVPFLNSKTSTNHRLTRIFSSFLSPSPFIDVSSPSPYVHKYSSEDSRKENAVSWETDVRTGSRVPGLYFLIAT